MRKLSFLAMAFTSLFASPSSDACRNIFLVPPSGRIYTRYILAEKALLDAGTVTTVSVSANAWDTRTSGSGCYPSGCLPALTRDGNQCEESRWSCTADLVEDGANCELTYEFEDPLDIFEILVAFYKGDERVRKLRVIVNGDYLTIESSGETESFETFLLGATGVSKITLEAIDLDEGEWISLTEVELMVIEDAETPTPSPTSAVTLPPTTVPTTPSTPNCTLELVGIDGFVTVVGGAMVTISAECEISSTVIIENVYGRSSGPLYVAGVSVDSMTVYFFSPPLDSSAGLTYLEVSVVVPTGDPIIPMVIPVSSLEVLGEASTTLVGIDDNAGSRASAITSPPIKNPLPHTATSLQISGTINSRRLQTDYEPLAFPKVITSEILFWIEQPAPEVTACEDLFSDNLSRCQCFFSIEQRTGGGVPVTAFPEEFRCPASIECILDAPEEEITGSGYISDGLSEPWISDLACPFRSCSWSSEGGVPPPLTAAELGVPRECDSWASLSFFCGLHPGAAFCIRTSDAPEGFANQCCYDERGQLLVDIASGGRTIDRVQTGIFTFKEHDAQDIQTFNWCCEEGKELDSWPCRMYSELRPTDAGEGAATCTAVDPSGTTVSTGKVTISADLPDFPGSLDFGFLVDISWGNSDDIVRLRELAGELLDGILISEGGNERILRLALGSFSDIPESPFGSSIDSPYILDKAFVSCSDEVDPSACAEADRQNGITAVDSLSILSGADGPDSQAIALNHAALDWEWGDGITKILAITTDAPFHTNNDDARYPPLDDVIANLNAKNIKVMALKAGSAGSEMDLLAAGTGGSVQEPASDSSDIVEAIVEGISDNTFSSVEVQWACRDDCGASDWQHTDSGVQTDVEGGTTAEFTVSLSAPSDLEAGVTCVALIIADEVLVGGKEFTMVSGTIASADITE